MAFLYLDPLTDRRHPLSRAGLLRGFNQEQAALRLMVRGVSPALLQAVEVQEFDLAINDKEFAQACAYKLIELIGCRS